MTIRKNIYYDNTFYFCTITCYNWLQLFELTKLYDHIYYWFDIINKKYKIKICTYVMMPNHLHLLFLVPDKVLKINKIIANGKRFMAYEIVKRLRKDKKRDILQSLEQGVSFKDKRRNKIHQVFEISSDLKVLLSERFILQKINYIHRNPVSKKWMLINDYRKYKYSSAGFYEGVLDYKGYPVTHYLDV